jgi:hypothetical protein
MSSTAEKNEFDFRATEVQVTEDQLIIILEDGREVRAPIEFYPKLAAADLKTRQNCRLIGPGIGIEWPDIDEHLSIEGIILGRKPINW